MGVEFVDCCPSRVSVKEKDCRQPTYVFGGNRPPTARNGEPRLLGRRATSRLYHYTLSYYTHGLPCYTVDLTTPYIDQPCTCHTLFRTAHTMGRTVPCTNRTVSSVRYTDLTGSSPALTAHMIEGDSGGPGPCACCYSLWLAVPRVYRPWIPLGSLRHPNRVLEGTFQALMPLDSRPL